MRATTNGALNHLDVAAAIAGGLTRQTEGTPRSAVLPALGRDKRGPPSVRAEPSVTSTGFSVTPRCFGSLAPHTRPTGVVKKGGAEAPPHRPASRRGPPRGKARRPSWHSRRPPLVTAREFPLSTYLGREFTADEILALPMDELDGGCPAADAGQLLRLRAANSWSSGVGGSRFRRKLGRTGRWAD